MNDRRELRPRETGGSRKRYMGQYNQQNLPSYPGSVSAVASCDGHNLEENLKFREPVFAQSSVGRMSGVTDGLKVEISPDGR